MSDITSRLGDSTFQRSYLWGLFLPDIGNDDQLIQMNYWDIGNIPDRIIMAQLAKSVTIPMPTVDTVKQNHGNSFWYAAGTNDIGNITVDMVETESGNTYSYWMGWLRLMSNPNGTYNPPVFYKRQFGVWRYSTALKRVGYYVFDGCFVSAISDVQSDYSSSDLLSYQVTLTVDSLLHSQQVSGVDVSTRYNNIYEASKILKQRQKLVVNRKFTGLDAADISGLLQGAAGDIIG